MPLLTHDTTDSFPHGTAVKIKRHGYQRHYAGEIYDVSCGVVEIISYEGATMFRFAIDSDYATVATVNEPWTEIPHPQSGEWSDMRTMADAAPCKIEDVPLKLRRALKHDPST